ncbi:FecCD family ABC transporter permease [Latilactobacillus sakei]|jgi:iron complex transport system permease protein|uniref:FecCD family ABC transporter permease n=1 Tax=Latilactobacillus sakei TaxID=1599 RepID=UPI000C6F409F|nr:iron ABC transporter permease [Latilactobacillus sakei]SON66555.1 ferrichrome ABC transporter (permease) [Latilactobacillus sakei]VTU52208.1 Iron(III)-compound ABC transporter, membrane-spanning subunit [Lactobacillus sakei subsp. sakei 23K] [Latilactobacillus sakei]
MNMTTKRYRRWLVGLMALLIATTLISLQTGQLAIGPQAIGQLLIGQGQAQDALILVDFRMPRIIIAILVGFALAIAGEVLQSTTQNPLADTGFLGINSGAGIAVLLFITFAADQGSQIFILPVLALIGALVSAVVIVIGAYQKSVGITANRLLLTGVAVSTCFSALMVLLTLKLSPDNYQFVMTWLAGSIWGSSWPFIWALLPWLLLTLPYIFSKSQTLDAFVLKPDNMRSLGVDFQKQRLYLIGAAVILAGASVSISGGIGFIGLITPHIARRIIGYQHRYQLLLTGLLGSCFLLVADTCGKLLSPTAEIPAGIIVALIGAPYFIYLLIKTK